MSKLYGKLKFKERKRKFQSGWGSTGPRGKSGDKMRKRADKSMLDGSSPLTVVYGAVRDQAIWRNKGREPRKGPIGKVVTG